MNPVKIITELNRHMSMAFAKNLQDTKGMGVWCKTKYNKYLMNPVLETFVNFGSFNYMVSHNPVFDQVSYCHTCQDFIEKYGCSVFLYQDEEGNLCTKPALWNPDIEHPGELNHFIEDIIQYIQKYRTISDIMVPSYIGDHPNSNSASVFCQVHLDLVPYQHNFDLYNKTVSRYYNGKNPMTPNDYGINPNLTNRMKVKEHNKFLKKVEDYTAIIALLERNYFISQQLIKLSPFYEQQCRNYLSEIRSRISKFKHGNNKCVAMYLAYHENPTGRNMIFRGCEPKDQDEVTRFNEARTVPKLLSEFSETALLHWLYNVGRFPILTKYAKEIEREILEPFDESEVIRICGQDWREKGETE